MKKNVLLLIVIVAIACFLRFFQLGLNPPSLTWDEVAWGYNAYSLGVDGKDEFGRFLPVDYLESFGDFKPPVYAYLDVIPVKLFGLNEFSVRFPSALFGVLTVLVTYFLTKRILKQEDVALVAASLLAISPWHINLSRAAFEANVATFFIVTGVWLFLEAMEKKKWLLILSVASFILSLYTFNTARIVAPILVLLLAFGFRDQLLKMRKEVFISIIIGLVLVAPVARFLTTDQAKLRFREVNIFSDSTVVDRSNQQIANDGNTLWSKIIHNRRVGYSQEFLRHYFDNLTPQFLFIKGDGNPKFSTQDVGQLYLWESVFLLAGIFILFRKREGAWWIIPVWILVGILPAATARETPHALRIETTLPMFQILVAYGLVSIVSSIKYKVLSIKGKTVFVSIIGVLAVINFVYYIHGYYAHYSRLYSGEWQYGYKEAISYVGDVEDKYDKIYFTESLGRPYNYFLFFKKYNPEQFRKEAVVEREVLGFVHVRSFGRYFFLENIPEESRKGEKILYVDTPDSVPSGAHVEKEFYLLNGKKVLVAYIK